MCELYRQGMVSADCKNSKYALWHWINLYGMLYIHVQHMSSLVSGLYNTVKVHAYITTLCYLMYLVSLCFISTPILPIPILNALSTQ